MLMAKISDLRISESSFFPEQLFTASPARSAGLENPNMVVKQGKEEKYSTAQGAQSSSPQSFFLNFVHSLRRKKREQLEAGTGVHSHLWTVRDKDITQEHKLPANTPQEQGTHAV